MLRFLIIVACAYLISNLRTYNDVSTYPLFGVDAATLKIHQLINQLGDEQFYSREAASRELEAIGEASLEALEQAASEN